MKRYGLVTYTAGGASRAGILVDGSVIDVAKALGDESLSTTLAILNDWAGTEPRLAALAEAGAQALPLSEVRLEAPVPLPGAIYCAGANYRDHVVRMAQIRGTEPEPDPHEVGLEPWHFIKSSHSVAGPSDDVAMTCQKLDWEAELAVIIGTKCRDLTEDQAMGVIAGYAVANDLSARDLTVRKNGKPGSPFGFDWVGQKSFDGSCPYGPAMTPARFVADPLDLPIKLWINDTKRIDSNSRHMLFNIAEQIAHLSTRITLHPGDLILTGTPAGTGAETNEFLARGDRVRIEIGDLGVIENRII